VLQSPQRGDDTLLDPTILAAVLDDLQIAAILRLLDPEKHGDSLIRDTMYFSYEAQIFNGDTAYTWHYDISKSERRRTPTC
jgi:hypothetical protein